MKKLAVIIAGFLRLSAVHAQNDGLLWEISGNGLIKPSYLIGTIHLHCNPESIDKNAVRNAIKSSDTVAFEIDLSNIQALISQSNTAKVDNWVHLRLNLTNAEYRSLDSACKVLLNDSLINLDPANPFTLQFQMMFSKNFIGCNPFPVDFKLLAMAKEFDKPITGLESYAFQNSLLRSIPLNVQLKSLVEFSRNLDSTRKKMQDLFDAYDSHKISAICNFSKDASQKMNELKMDSSTIQRNLNWLAILKPRMAYKSYFVAVGSAHLCGEQGLIALLRKEGYTLTPVDF